MTAPPTPRPAAAPRSRRRRTGALALAALFLFMALVVYRSLHIGGVRCEVCITYRGAAQCRTVDGETREDALMSATTNACAYLSSGVTDGIACNRTPPTKSECTEID
jgi:hypothetical protein